jgi:serine/threonine protein kinase
MGLGRLQSAWLRKCLEQNNSNDDRNLLKRMEDGEWMELAQRRYVDGLTNTPTRKDDENLTTLLELLSSKRAPFSSLLGELNLNDYYDDENADPNEWYKRMGVKPPRPGSVWLVFDYHGTSTAASYAVPPMFARSKIPPKRGVFGWGVVEPPPLPPFGERARYVVRGVLRGMMGAVSIAHESGIVHRSIGRNSFILSSVGQDKLEATSPYAVVISRLRVVLSDWGFSALAEDAARERESGVRSRMFGIPGVDSYEDRVSSNDDRIAIAAAEFAKAEDLNALGFV